MRPVFLETTWVVGYAAPAHLGMASAKALINKPDENRRLYLPAVCISEARQTIARKYQAKHESDRVRQYLVWVSEHDQVSPDDNAAVLRVLDQMEASVKEALKSLDHTLDELGRNPRLEVFPLSEQMLERTLDLSSAGVDLQPFDLAILGAILVRAGQIQLVEGDEITFCCLDSDLQPWHKGGFKRPMADLYEAARIKVYSSFEIPFPSTEEMLREDRER